MPAPAPAERASILDVGGSGGVQINPAGRIVDVIDPETSRLDTPEERVRQEYARILLEEYGYPRDRIVLGPAIYIGREPYFADIVVYASAEAARSRSQGEISLVIETKKPTLSEGKGQLVSYIFASSAQGGVWTNGEDVAYYRRVDSPHPHLKDWTNIPRLGEAWDTVGHYRKEDLRPPRDLKRVFQRCHNAIYRAGLDSEDVALDMVRIILAKYRDEQNEGEVCEFRCTPEEFATPDGRRQAADRVHQLFKQVVRDHPDVFPPGEEITIGDDNLAVVVNELQPFRFLADDETEQVYDVIGTAFEVYVAAHLKGARGQYFTNRLVVNLMVEMLDPSARDIIYDPACGSGGFLISCLRYVRRKVYNSRRSPAAKLRETREASQRLIGTDIAQKLVRVAKTNMILNGDGHGGIIRANALRDPGVELPVTFPLNPDSPGYVRPTIILTNPPFGASHELRERSRDVLRQFQLGHVWDAASEGMLQPTAAINDAEGVPPEILFLERCVEMLPPGGRLAIVIARGVLDNRDALPARQYLLTHTKLLAVINCHPNTFAPFNGTKAAILVVQKKRTPGIVRGEDYPVFMAISEKVGQDSQGREILQRDLNGDLVIVDGQPAIDHDLGEIAESWRRFRNGQAIAYEAAWSINLGRILFETELRFNPTRYAPAAERALAQVLELGGSDEWVVERLGDFATVFNGPRFKRPFADAGVREGTGIVRMYTPKAFFEERGESAKYLDLNRATRTQKRQIDVLTLERDYILVVDSGTAGKLLGRVGMTTAAHSGAVGNNNLIRVVILDPIRRDYVYQFLRSELGRTLLLRNVYGTNQDHIEPEDVKDIPIPFPKDVQTLARIHEQVRRVSALREQALAIDAEATTSLSDLFSDVFDVPSGLHTDTGEGGNDDQ